MPSHSFYAAISIVLATLCSAITQVDRRQTSEELDPSAQTPEGHNQSSASYSQSYIDVQCVQAQTKPDPPNGPDLRIPGLSDRDTSREYNNTLNGGEITFSKTLCVPGTDDRHGECQIYFELDGDIQGNLDIEVKVSIHIYGLYYDFGDYTGNLKTGIHVHINLLEVKGNLYIRVVDEAGYHYFEVTLCGKFWTWKGWHPFKVVKRLFRWPIRSLDTNSISDLNGISAGGASDDRVDVS